MRSILFIFIFTLLFGNIFSTSCNFDYECNIPFGNCAGSTTNQQDNCKLSPGFSIDEAQSKLYFSGRCNEDPQTPDNSGQGYIFSSNLDGSSLTRITPVHELLVTDGFSELVRFLDVSKDAFYVVKSERIGLDVYSIDRTTFEETSLLSYHEAPFNVFFDNAHDITYACEDNQIYKFNEIVTQSVNSYSDAYIIYNSTEFNNTFCSDVAEVGDDLYILTLSRDNSGRTFIWKGNNLGTAELELYLTIYGEAQFFDVTSTAIFYAYDHFVYRHFLQPTALPTQLTTERGPNVAFNSIQSFEGFTYYNNGTHIRRVDELTLNTETVIGDSFSVPSSNSTSSGKTCQCRPGFSGDSCNQCSTVIQWNNGIPSCPELNENGLPSSCSVHSDCGNSVPYVQCNSAGACECASGFTGSDCTTCDGQVQWNNGNPSCVSILDNGLPATCDADYQCLNPPYTACDSTSRTCYCRGNLSGSQCTECSGQISWENGLPSCN